MRDTPTPTLEPLLLSLDQVLLLFGVSKDTIYRMISAGEFPRPVRVRRCSRWRREQVLAALDRLRA